MVMTDNQDYVNHNQNFNMLNKLHYLLLNVQHHDHHHHHHKTMPQYIHQLINHLTDHTMMHQLRSNNCFNFKHKFHTSMPFLNNSDTII
ncbi:hypothetical protein M0802_013859 [Mischocyttarus mexicanus]|nr:hypothetical protein M0802_013865 [Mischocyttarus mexicanus]KAI4481899.1 hypothetical protein M0802_013859 [Mischocyttarus mexicanus]